MRHNPRISANFFVVSDTHFFHDNIVKYCNRAKQIHSLLGVNMDHNRYMVERWNEVVGDNDMVLHLGDLYAWFKNGREKFEYEILPRLNGRIYMLRGNHDKDHDRVYRQMGINMLEPFSINYKGQTVQFDHYPQARHEVEPGVIRVHGHIHNNGYPKTADWKEGSTSTQAQQINVSVEVIDYTPQWLPTLLDNFIEEQNV